MSTNFSVLSFGIKFNIYLLDFCKTEIVRTLLHRELLLSHFSRLATLPDQTTKKSGIISVIASAKLKLMSTVKKFRLRPDYTFRDWRRDAVLLRTI